ncbi:hypothetical protein KC333_g99 [Hortaea werneckii]|nr:hypothetical protein KC333_g99 [Hortaea werneckii]
MVSLERWVVSLHGLAVGVAVGVAIGSAIAIRMTVGAVLLAVNGDILLVVVVDVQTETGGVDAAVAPDEQRTEHRLREQIKDTVEDGLRVGRNDVATLTQTPCDGVKGPEEGSQTTAVEEGATNVPAHGVGVLASLPAEDESNVEEGSTAEGKVAPFVPGVDERANETGHDHDPVDEDDVENGRPWHRSRQEKVHEKQRGGDEPGRCAGTRH